MADSAFTKISTFQNRNACLDKSWQDLNCQLVRFESHLGSITTDAEALSTGAASYSLAKDGRHITKIHAMASQPRS